MLNSSPPVYASKSTLVAVTLALSAMSHHAHATLTSYTSNGADLVYSSVSNVTWTKDANLLGTLLAASTDADGNGNLDLIDAMTVGNNVVSASRDFSSLGNGTASLFGALAFVIYLNRINYGGVSNWYLPTVANTTAGLITSTNGDSQGDEMAELFYSELSGIADKAIPNTGTFDNEQASLYWSGTIDERNLRNAWFFINGFQNTLATNNHLYVWAVSPGRVATVSTVPAPAAAWMFASALPLLGAVARRRKEGGWL